MVGDVSSPKDGNNNATVEYDEVPDNPVVNGSHSHPSGTTTEVIKTPKAGGVPHIETITTPYEQVPSETDVGNASSQIRYVFAMGDGVVYMYNNQGVQATLPIENFVKINEKK